MSEKLTFTDISKLLEEYAGNEVAIHILKSADDYPACLNTTVRILSNRQDVIYKSLLVTCGLEVQE